VGRNLVARLRSELEFSLIENHRLTLQINIRLLLRLLSFQLINSMSLEHIH
jgi:hypothetical protein